MEERQFIYDYGDDLAKDSFTCLVGRYAYYSPKAVHYDPNNAHHVYLWLENPSTGKLYECAVHTRLSINSDVWMCCFREPCPVEQWPPFGLAEKQPMLSYRELGLKKENFTAIGERCVGEQLRALGTRSDRVQVYGFGHFKGNGLHNIHQSSGEPEKVKSRKSYLNQDGAIVFYFSERPEMPANRVWVCLKFEAQSLEEMIHVPKD